MEEEGAESKFLPVSPSCSTLEARGEEGEHRLLPCITGPSPAAASQVHEFHSMPGLAVLPGERGVALSETRDP